MGRVIVFIREEDHIRVLPNRKSKGNRVEPACLKDVKILILIIDE